MFLKTFFVYACYIFYYLLKILILPGSDTAETSLSLISHSQDYGLRVTEESFRIGDIVKIYMRTTKNGSVSEIDANRPNRVKTDTLCPRYFRRVLKLIYRPPSFDVYEFHWFTIKFRMRDFAVFLILSYSYL